MRDIRKRGASLGTVQAERLALGLGLGVAVELLGKLGAELDQPTVCGERSAIAFLDVIKPPPESLVTALSKTLPVRRRVSDARRRRRTARVSARWRRPHACARCDDPHARYPSIMKPFRRETVVDRRQPAVRWSAVFAGAAVAIAAWMLLQLFGSGVALTASDAEELDNVRGIGIGTTAWSVIATLIAMFLGGVLAGRLAGHHERRVAGLHGLLVWAATSIVGFTAISAAVAMMSSGYGDTFVTPEPGVRDELARALEPANARLRLDGKPQVAVNQLIEAARSSEAVDGYDRNLFISRLDERTPLTRPDVEAVVRGLGNRAPELIASAKRLGAHRVQAVKAAERTGCMFLVASFALALGLVAAIGGALLAARELVRRRGLDVDPPHTTSPYPVQPMPPDTD